MTQPVELRERLRQRTRTSTNKSPVTKSITPEQRLVWVQIALTLLPLITACIYLFGMSRHMGYLGVFNVDSSEFPLSTEQTILMGAIALVSNLIPLFGYSLVAFAVALILLLITALTFGLLKKLRNHVATHALRIGNNALLHRMLKPLLKYAMQPHESGKWEFFFEMALAWYLRYCFLILICSSIFVLALYSHRDGEKEAKTQIESITQGTYAAANQLRYAKHPEGIPAIRIMCNSIQCTFWTKADGTIFLRHDQIDSVVIPPEDKKPALKK
jgi:hypothetical protein